MSICFLRASLVDSLFKLKDAYDFVVVAISKIVHIPNLRQELFASPMGLVGDH